MRRIELIEKKRDIFEDRKFQIKIHNEHNTTSFDLSECELIGIKIILDEKFKPNKHFVNYGSPNDNNNTRTG